MFRSIFGRIPDILVGMLLVFCLAVTVSAEEVPMAENISGKKLVEDQKGFSSVNMLFDGREKETGRFRDGAHMTLSHEAGIGSLYLIFDVEYGSYTITNLDTQESYSAGEAGFLHEFVDLQSIFGAAPSRVQLSFDNGDGKLNELYAFSPGEPPEFVQKWQQPADGETDLVLFSTHGDDEQLFFAGILPYYAAERNCQVQVVYMTGHRNMSMRRSHEMLDGLWAVGIKAYPVFGPFGDYNSTSLEESYRKYRQKGISEEDILSFVVENIRRFRPKAAVGHDLNGEYGHGMHMVYAQLLCRAVEVSADPDQFPESAETYGVWDVPKTYLHLYPENPIVMDWDQPLQSFGGMTAFEVTKKLGFPCHASQQTYYGWYFSGKDSAAEITQYSPCEFGLYRSTVGQDLQKNDFLENLTTYAQDAEAERLLREQIALQEAEEAARQQETEPESETQPERTQTEPEVSQPQEPAQDRKDPLFLVLGGAALVLILLTTAGIAVAKRRR